MTRKTGLFTTLFCLFVVLLIPSTACRALSDEAQVRLARQAAVGVTSPVDGAFLGTAFCIDARGYFLTSRQVAAQSTEGLLSLVHAPGEREERTLRARVVRSDDTSDLALLLSEKPVGKTLTLGNGDLDKVWPLRAFGYSSDAAAPDKGTAGKRTPDTAVPDPVTPVDEGLAAPFGLIDGNLIFHLRRSDSRHTIVRDARPDADYHGGPLLDAGGRVVGVVTLGRGRMVHHVTPVKAVRAFLSKPLLRADFPKSVPWADRNKPVHIKAALDYILDDAPQWRPILTINQGSGDREVQGTKKGDGYVFKTRLLAEQDPSWVRLNLKLADETLICFARDRALSGKIHPYRLSELKGYRRGEGLQPKRGRKGPLKTENDTLTVYLADNPIEIPLRSVEAFTVEPQEAPTSVRYHLSVEAQGVGVAGLDGVIHVDRPHKPFHHMLERMVPAPITDVTLAGNGRFMLLRMDALEQLAVFDTSALEIVKTLPLPEPHTLVAGGASTLVLAQPEQRIIQSWSLDTLERERIAALPHKGVLTHIGMGYGSDGPLLIRTSVDDAQINFINPATFNPIPYLSNVKTVPRSGRHLHYRFSADGRTIVAWDRSEMEVMTLSETEISINRPFDQAGYLVPAPDGAYSYSLKGVFAAEQENVTETPDDFLTIPTMHPGFFLGIERRPESYDTLSPVQLSLYAAGARSPMRTLPDTPEVQLTAEGKTDMLTVDQLIHFDPRTKVLITIHKNRDRLVARYVDLAGASEGKAPEPGSFYVDSFPPKRVERMGFYRYPISVKGQTGQVQYSLDTGPEDMKFLDNGVLSWRAGEPEEVPIVVGIRDNSGRVLRHAFTIVVEP